MIEKIAHSLIRIGEAMIRRDAAHVSQRSDGQQVTRRDSGWGFPSLWRNLMTGAGGTADNMSGWMPGPVVPLDYEILRSLWNGHALSRRIVSSLPDKAFAKGFKIVYGGKKKLEERRIKPLIEQEAERLRVLQRAHHAAIFGRLYGGTVIMASVKDGLPSQPIRPKRVKHIESLIVVGAPRAYPMYAHLDTMSDDANRRYPDHFMYYVSPYGLGRTLTVHPSRLAVFGGVPTDTEDRWLYYRGWDASAIQPLWDDLRRMAGNSLSVGRMLTQAGRKILKMPTLNDIITGVAGDEAYEALLTRLQMIISTESSMNCMAIAGDEDYQYVSQPMTGVSEVTSRDRSDLAAGANMPETELFGETQTGLSKTGEFDIKKWWAAVEAYQREDLTEPLEWLVWLIALSAGSSDPENWGIEWPDPSTLTAKEKADLYLTNAQADAIYVQGAVIDPQRLAVWRFNPAGYNPEPPTIPELDVQFLNRSADRNHTELEPGEEGT